MAPFDAELAPEGEPGDQRHGPSSDKASEGRRAGGKAEDLEHASADSAAESERVDTHRTPSDPAQSRPVAHQSAPQADQAVDGPLGAIAGQAGVFEPTHEQPAGMTPPTEREPVAGGPEFAFGLADGSKDFHQGTGARRATEESRDLEQRGDADLAEHQTEEQASGFGHAAAANPAGDEELVAHRKLADPAFDATHVLVRPTLVDQASSGNSGDQHLAGVAPRQTPEPVPLSPGRSRRGVYWLLLFMVLAGVLGLLAGVGVVLRGQTLGPSGTAQAGARPTFVIGAPVSPVPIGSPSPVAVAQPATAADYVVQSGDTLRSIAQTVYGDADQWPRIYDANRQLIGPDPDALQEGMRLRLP